MTEGVPDILPERPIECGNCKKAVKVLYTEIVGDTVVRTEMCSDCPELARHLHGAELHEKTLVQVDGVSGLCCGACGTTLEDVKRGGLLGCDECYTIFGEILVAELLAANKLPSRFNTIKKTIPMHIGRTPGELITHNLSSRLVALNEALNETIRREDYEQAALLRDQIRELTENTRSKNSDKNIKKEKNS
jgi:protein arginine kinase activator